MMSKYPVRFEILNSLSVHEVEVEAESAQEALAIAVGILSANPQLRTFKMISFRNETGVSQNWNSLVPR